MTKINTGAIKPRHMQFDTQSMDMPQFAIEDNSLISTFFYALSAMFPEGERFFIHSVRHYQKSISDPDMIANIKRFHRARGTPWPLSR